MPELSFKIDSPDFLALSPSEKAQALAMHVDFKGLGPEDQQKVYKMVGAEPPQKEPVLGDPDYTATDPYSAYGMALRAGDAVGKQVRKIPGAGAVLDFVKPGVKWTGTTVSKGLMLPTKAIESFPLPSYMPKTDENGNVTMEKTTFGKVLKEGPAKEAGKIIRQVGGKVAALPTKLLREQARRRGYLPIVESSPELTFATELPGGVGEVPVEFAAITAENAPEQALLGAAGMAAKATGAFQKIAAGTEKVAPFLVHRGGMLPKSKEALATMDAEKVMGALEAEDRQAILLYHPSGIKFADMDQKALGQLLEQSDQRKVLSAMHEAPVQVDQTMGTNLRPKAGSAQWALSAAAREVPGRTGSRLAAANPVRSPLFQALREGQTKPVTFADVADDIAQRLHVDFDEVAKVSKKNPSEMSRLWDDLMYDPIAFDGDFMGIFPVRHSAETARTETGFLTQRKQMTDVIRQGKGLVEKPAAPVAAATIKMRDFIATRKLQEKWANDPDISRFPTGTVRNDWDTVPIEGWGKATLIPDNEKAFGLLAGKLVRAPEATALKYEAQAYTAADRVIREWHGLWRWSKIIPSPKTWFANGVSGIMQAHGAGLSPYRMDIYNRAAKALGNKNDPLWTELRSAGADWTTGQGLNINDVMDAKLLSESNRPPNMLEAWLTIVPKVLTRNKFSMGLAKGYQTNDAYFKTATYAYRREMGDDVATAIKIADDAIGNYDKQPLWVRRLRSSPTGIPFISFTYAMVPRVIQAGLERPQLLQQYAFFGKAWNNVAAKALGLSEKERDDILNHPTMEGKFPLLSPIPWADGTPQVYDMARKTPLSDMIPNKISPAGAQPSILNTLAGMTVGRNPYTSELISQVSGNENYYKKPFARPLGSEADAAIGADVAGLDSKTRDILFRVPGEIETQARVAHLARTFMPDIMGGGGFQNVARAVRGKRSYYGNKITPLQALAETFVLGPAMNPRERTAGALVSLKKLEPEAKAIIKGAETKRVLRESMRPPKE